ncbi:MAG: hypothetical protein OEZ28_05515 [Nitrospinota bacterium]|nr:hypothetical protein [Nitrospinota bacterium]
MVLLTALNAGNPSPIAKLYNTLRDNYSGFSFAVTRPVIQSSDVVQTVKDKASQMKSACSGKSPEDCVKSLAKFPDVADALPNKEDVKDEITGANAIDFAMSLAPWPF